MSCLDRRRYFSQVIGRLEIDGKRVAYCQDGKNFDSAGEEIVEGGAKPGRKKKTHTASGNLKAQAAAATGNQLTEVGDVDGDDEGAFE